MAAPKKPTKQKPKGLSDKELIAKYESGKVPVKKIMKALLTTPPHPKKRKGINNLFNFSKLVNQNISLPNIYQPIIIVNNIIACI
jgi:hypothetical protein